MTERLRILFVPHAYAPALGGTEWLCQRVAETFAANHDVRILTSDAGAVDAYYRLGIAPVRGAPTEINGVPVTRVRLGGGLYAWAGRVLPLVPLSWLRVRLEGRTLHMSRRLLRRQFARAIAACRPDVVVTMPHLVANVEAVLAAHDAAPFSLAMLPMLHEHDPHWDQAAMRVALTRANAVIALTNAERERLVAAYAVPAGAAFIGGMGVDVPPAESPRADRPPTVVFIGRKAPEKGVLLLLDAMRLVWRTRSDARLVLAGARGAASHQIAAAIAALPPEIRSRVSSEDNVSDARKHAILADASCLALPSRVESFGGVILEAWAHGVPSVTWDLPVFREIVDDRVNGSLVPPGDTDALASAILWFLEHREQAAAMGRAGREKARAEYAWPMVAARYLDACRYAVHAFREERAARTARGAPSVSSR